MSLPAIKREGVLAKRVAIMCNGQRQFVQQRRGSLVSRFLKQSAVYFGLEQAVVQAFRPAHHRVRQGRAAQSSTNSDAWRRYLNEGCKLQDCCAADG